VKERVTNSPGCAGFARSIGSTEGLPVSSLGVSTACPTPSIIVACPLDAAPRCTSPAADKACWIVSWTFFSGPTPVFSPAADSARSIVAVTAPKSYARTGREGAREGVTWFNRSRCSWIFKTDFRKGRFNECDRRVPCARPRWREKRPEQQRIRWWRGPISGLRRRRCAPSRRPESAASAQRRARARARRD
jgi:hypothetical protein